MNINYIRVGDYFIPDLTLPEEIRPIGRWGRMHREYLREHKPIQYNCLLLSGKLWTYLADLNEQAQDRLERMIDQMKAAEGMIARTNVMVSIICIIFGIYVLADALLKVQIAIDAKAFGISKWWLILAVAILTGVAGFLLVLRPSESAQILMVLLGLSLISEGLLNLITILTAVKIIRRQRPEIIDTDTAE